jgi:hypothetical protein
MIAPANTRSRSRRIQLAAVPSRYVAQVNNEPVIVVSTCRVIAAVAADPERQRFSGGVYSSATLSETYPFTDLDGSRPNIKRYFEKHHPELMKGKEGVAEWASAGPLPMPRRPRSLPDRLRDGGASGRAWP